MAALLSSGRSRLQGKTSYHLNPRRTVGKPGAERALGARSPLR